MNNRDDKNAKLLAETFHDDWTAGPASGFARAAAAHARRRRNVRRTVSAATAAAALAAIALLTRHEVAPPARNVAPAPAPIVAIAYEILSDDELLARVHNQPLLVVKKLDGTREITVLPKAEKTSM
ncbi:MAG TPA: hypothetical protein VM029_22550 [Opitutaceae bacterium]|nr:hypothetical protein [Opitutaceae bacterium]